MVIGQGGQSAFTYGVRQSKTALLDKRTTLVPAATSRRASDAGPMMLIRRASLSFSRQAAKLVMAAQKKAMSALGSGTASGSKDARSSFTVFLLAGLARRVVEQTRSPRAENALASAPPMVLSNPITMAFIVQD